MDRLPVAWDTGWKAGVLRRLAACHQQARGRRLIDPRLLVEIETVAIVGINLGR